MVKGRFAPKNFEGILRRYVNEYVICNGCKNSDTILSKENRLFFLRCEQCGSGRSVAPVKLGFVARVGRRTMFSIELGALAGRLGFSTNFLAIKVW